MKKFALIFRMDITTPGAQPTPEQMQGYMQQWMKWIDGMSAKGQLAEGGNHFSPQGKLIKPGPKITDGPYVSGTDSVAGYILINATNLDEAVKMAEKCPILQGKNTSVEIRETATP